MFNFFGNLPEYLIDALKDSLNLIPFLFVIFLFIEIFEYYFSHKIKDFFKCSKGIGPLVGALAAIIPQCGFSVIISTLYIRKFVSVGTLLAVYIATSDEAIPILMASPNQMHSMLKIILVKCVLAIIVGYLADFIVAKIPHTQDSAIVEEIDDEKGCCGHDIVEKKMTRFILHPFKHTIHIFVFIFFVCLALNYLFTTFGMQNIQHHMLQNSIFQPIITSIIGLIPNCAISIIITVMFINGVISFGSTTAGLSSSAGLGLLVLVRKNTSWKNTLSIILTLFSVSAFIGILIQLLN